MNESQQPPSTHPMTILESPTLNEDQYSNPQQWENPRLAPPSPHVHYLTPPSPPLSAHSHHPHFQGSGQTIDEDLRLRIVRTPTESLHEVAREDERRRVGKRKQRKGTLRKTLFGQGSKLSRGFSIGGSSIKSPTSANAPHDGVPLPVRPGTSGSASASGGQGTFDAIGMSLQGMNDFAQSISKDVADNHSSGSGSNTTMMSPTSISPIPASTQLPSTRTANQEEEAKAEQFATPAIAEGLSSSSSSTAGGLSSQSSSSSSHPSNKKHQRGSVKSFFSFRNNDKKQAELRRRRNVYLNIELPMNELDKYGLPREYSRNKVRTSKYTLWTFIPKNLSEQFRRVANLYFLGLIILQIFPIFGGTSPYVAMLPLLAILLITAVKDGIEDYRRQQLDEAVNNSAVTRLGDWHNVNVATYQRSFLSRLFGLKSQPPSRKSIAKNNRSKKVSKGVRKLREKEGELNMDFLYEGGSSLMQSQTDLGEGGKNQVNTSIAMEGRNNSLEILDSRDSSHYAPTMTPQHSNNTSNQENRGRSDSLARSMAASSSSLSRTATTGRKYGVVDYDRQSPGTAKWERTLWKKLEVGDVVLLRENDQVPADIVVLSTSDPDGQCFVETKNLDGETNLKPRRALKATLGIQHEEDIEHSEFLIDSEPPHANLYSYNGVLKYYTKEQTPGREHPIIEHEELKPKMEKKEAITINELLLRGCAIRNTTWVIGLVVYTGADTKIMLNQGETPSKRSKIEKETNFNVLANFVILLAMCIACGIANGLFLNQDDTSARSYEKGVNPAANNIINAVVTFGACLIVFQNIVPISLIITVELVKTIQAIFIYQDIDMWYEPLDHPCVPKTWNISDDLGQIEYIFSDKTGTLTQNVMEFKKCSINGVSYGEGVTEAMLGQAKREGKDTSAFDPVQNEALLERSKQEMIQLMKQNYKNRYLREDKVTFIAPKAVEDLVNKSAPEQRQAILHFFRALAICHTVLGDRSDPDDQNIIDYKAESPDEAALVGAARDCGFVFLQRSNAEIEIEVMGQIERYQPLRVLEFNSSRKRMSVIVRQPDGRILMICKGADSVIYQRLKADHDSSLKNATEKDMEEFANSGLRTLCIAYRYLPEEEFVQWAALYDAACAAVTDREDEIEKACELVEKDLVIMGATALEDKLQVGVPDAIAQLHKAGIKLWILTGDKVQTAIEIGFSCNLLTNAMDIMIISSDTDIGARAQIEAGLDKVNKAQADPATRPEDGFALVIDGETLRHALDPSLKPLFLDLTTQCSAVVCCRVSPSQKALTVKLVKDGKNAMTLAIGDGANDVAMIQEAHIGVGIAGLEGAQASMSADYAIGQFRFLTKLLLVHGRWCYIRVAEMHANFFYKNIVWVFAMFWYQFFCNFDSSYLFDYSLVLLYNLAFTSLPVIVMGAFDQDIDAKNSLANPQLYKRGIQGLEYSRAVFWSYMLDGLYQSAVVFFVPFVVYYYSTAASTQGYGMDAVVELGTTVAASAVITVTIFLGINNSYQTGLMIGVLVVSALLLYIWVAIYSAFPYTFNYLVVILFSTVDFWAVLIITQVIAIGPRFLYKYIQSNYFPTDNNIIREMAVLRKPRMQLSDMDTEAGFDGQEKKRGTTPAPHLDVRISRTPLPFEDGDRSNQQLEMSELHGRRASLPLDAHRFPPTSPDVQRHQPYDTTLSPPKQQYGQSAIPIIPSPTTRRQQLHNRAPPPPDAYEEIAVGRSPSTPTSPTLRERYEQMGRERQDSNTPLTPHMYDGSYGSPPLSPRHPGVGHYRLQTGSSSLTRENSSTSFATARSGADTDAESDYGYAR